MSNDVLETRLFHCEEGIKGVTDQLKEVTHQIQENEKTLYRVTVLQEMTEKQVSALEHKMKNNDVAMKMIDDEQQKIKTKFIEATAEKQAKKKFFKDSNNILVFLLTCITIIGVIYDRMAEYFAK
jgi:hypothetical protein